MKKTFAAAFAAVAVLAAATPAAATIYTYEQTNGDILRIDTATNSGTMIGDKINVSFTSDDIAGFTGGDNPTAMFVLSDLEGYRLINGQEFHDNSTTHMQKLKIDSAGRTNLWSHWGDNAQYGDYITYIGEALPPVPSAPSSSGGNTGGSTGGSTGGTDVPAPGMVLLFGAGAAALAFRRRRNKKAD